MLQLNNISLSYGSRTLFDEVNITIRPGDRIGLVGRNGTGKSTLLQIISGKIKSDGGNIAMPNGYLIAHLTQDIRIHKHDTIWDEALSAFDTYKLLEKEYEAIEQEMLSRSDYDSDDYMDLSQRMCDIQDHLMHFTPEEVDKQIELVLKGLGFKQELFSEHPSILSGGWNMRLELAKLLLQAPDLLLLDEPTNHLDIHSIIWLEKFLSNYSGAVMLVSHDVAFMNNIVKKIYEIELGNFYEYIGNYHKYMELKVMRKEQQTAAYNNQQQQIKQMERNIERFRAKASKATFAQSLIKKLDKMDVIEIEQNDTSSLKFTFPAFRQSGKVVLKADHLSHSYGEKNVLQDVSIEIEREDKVAFIGKNGMGKTTFTNIMTQELYPTIGKIDMGFNVEIGYFTQHHASLLPKELTIYQYMDTIADGEIRRSIRGILGAFLFSGDDVDKKISVLSGGERARVCLAALLLKPTNLLILDEPTNHLDIVAKESLKDAIRRYQGTVIIVSHDREFLSGLTNKLFEFKDGKIIEHLYSIEEFLERQELESLRNYESEKTVKEKAISETNKTSTPTPKDNSKIIRNLELQIAELEKEILTLEQSLSKSQYDEQKSLHYNAKKTQLDDLYVSLEKLME
jgi:ATP-binding cassette subfamily F protein 3